MIEKLIVMDNSVRLTISITTSAILFILMIIFKDTFGLFLGLIMILTMMLNPYITSIKNQRMRDSITIDNDDYVIKNIPRYDDYIFGSDNKIGLVIDELNEKLYILTRNHPRHVYEKNEFNFSQILESGIIEDENMLIKTSKSGLIGGSLLGGVLAGGVGSVIGAMASNKSTINQVSNLKLNIVVDDIMNPIYTIPFLISDNPIKKEEIIYKKIMETSTLWHKRMSVIIKRNEK